MIPARDGSCLGCIDASVRNLEALWVPVFLIIVAPTAAWRDFAAWIAGHIGAGDPVRRQAASGAGPDGWKNTVTISGPVV
jgi:hypothetical protein